MIILVLSNAKKYDNINIIKRTGFPQFKEKGFIISLFVIIINEKGD